METWMMMKNLQICESSTTVKKTYYTRGRERTICHVASGHSRVRMMVKWPGQANRQNVTLSFVTFKKLNLIHKLSSSGPIFYWEKQPKQLCLVSINKIEMINYSKTKITISRAAQVLRLVIRIITMQAGMTKPQLNHVLRCHYGQLPNQLDQISLICRILVERAVW